MMAVSLVLALPVTSFVAGSGGFGRFEGLHNNLYFLSDLFDVSVLCASSPLFETSGELVAFLTSSSIHCAFPIPALISFSCWILMAFGFPPISLAIIE